MIRLTRECAGVYYYDGEDIHGCPQRFHINFRGGFRGWSVGPMLGCFLYFPRLRDVRKRLQELSA